MSQISESEKWLVRPKPNPDARLRLFCLPFAGGTAMVFRTWPDDLPLDIELCAVQLPGRETRLQEPPFSRMTDLVPVLDRALRPFLDRPFVLFGHSMGGLISFELIRHWRRKGDALPLHLFVSGRRSPDSPCRFPDMHDLPRGELIKKIRDYGGTPEAVLEEEELMDLIIPIIRADFSILETYKYYEEKPLDLPITVYAGTEDIRTTPDELEAWRRHTTASVAVRNFSGDHFFLQSVRDVVLQALSEDLSRIMP